MECNRQEVMQLLSCIMLFCHSLLLIYLRDIHWQLPVKQRTLLNLGKDFAIEPEQWGPCSRPELNSFCKTQHRTKRSCLILKKSVEFNSAENIQHNLDRLTGGMSCVQHSQFIKSGGFKSAPFRYFFIASLNLAFGLESNKMPKGTSDSFALPLSSFAGIEIRRDCGKFLSAISPKLTREGAKHFDKFNKSVLIAWSHEDRLFPIEDANKLHQQFHDSKIVFIEDSYTFSAIDNPKQLTNEIRIF